MKNAKIAFPFPSSLSAESHHSKRLKRLEKNQPGPSSLILFPMEKEALILYNMNTRN